MGVDRILQIEHELETKGLRLEAIARAPEVDVCEGTPFATAFDCSVYRGKRIDELLDEIEALNLERALLLSEAA